MGQDIDCKKNFASFPRSRSLRLLVQLGLPLPFRPDLPGGILRGVHLLPTPLHGDVQPGLQQEVQPLRPVHGERKLQEALALVPLLREHHVRPVQGAPGNV